MASGVSTIQIYDADRRPVQTDTSTVEPNDAHHLSIALPSVSPGVYTVVWANVSVDDGHPNKGGFSFTMQTPAGTAAVPAAITSTSDLVGSPPIRLRKP